MSLDLPESAAEPVGSIERLIQEFREAEKPPSAHRLGLEHEKFVYPRAGTAPVPYAGPNGIEALLNALADRSGKAFRESPHHPVIAVQRGEATLSLEPGGQLEMSGTAASTARAVHEENLAHVAEVHEVGSALGLRLVALGYRPWGSPATHPWMPKTRYQMMHDTLGKRGSLALDMMLMTATGQVSIDWETETDCARKMTVISRLTPALIALYANSPLVQGKPSGYLSFRSHVWTDTDSARCGFFPAMLDGHFTYRSYVEWALDAPLLFLRRHGHYLTPQTTFRRLLDEGFQGAPPTLQDWRDHLSTLFPEVRLKRVLEVRGADCVNPALTGALAAFIRGIAYDSTALKEAEALMPVRSFEAHTASMETARREGLRDPKLLKTARDLLSIAHAGLQRLDAADLPILQPLEALAASGKSPAEAVLAVASQGPLAVFDAFTI